VPQEAPGRRRPPERPKARRAASPATRAEPARHGTQSIERTLRILRELAARGEFGWRLSDLAARCEIDKGTAHRVLACLVRERVVQRGQADKRYFPGPMLFELGLSRPDYAAFQRACSARLAPLARQMDAIAWLLLRSGNDYLCAAREGTAAPRGFLVQVGTRRPLFASVGGAAILPTLPDAEARAILKDNTDQEIAQRGRGRLAGLKQMRDQSRAYGFGVNLGDVVPGLHAFAAPVRGVDGRAFAAVCLTGLAEQFGLERLDELRAAVCAVALEVEQDARRLLDGMRPADAQPPEAGTPT